MRVQQETPTEFEFYIRDLDNLVLVENNTEGVVIRATRNNFSERRKSFFIRQLAAEGYIPDIYQWFSDPTDNAHGLTWVVDYSWLRIPETVVRSARRFMIRSLVGSVILFVIAMRLVFMYCTAPVSPQATLKAGTRSNAPLMPIANTEPVEPVIGAVK
jgi:hypothetical protein